MAFCDRIRSKGTAQPSEKEDKSEEADPCDEKEFAPRFQKKKINVFITMTEQEEVLEICLKFIDECYYLGVVGLWR